MCVKGGEPKGTLLIGIRDRSGGAIEYVDFTKLFHKREATKAGTITNRYSRAMVARITLDEAVPHLGSSFNVMAVHVHNKLANMILGRNRLEEF